jgi:hypothetical protein
MATLKGVIGAGSRSPKEAFKLSIVSSLRLRNVAGLSGKFAWCQMYKGKNMTKIPQRTAEAVKSKILFILFSPNMLA